MPCACNNICTSGHCPLNSDCNGHVDPCLSNQYPFTSVDDTFLIRASHIQELQDAIDTERADGTRRFTSTACPGNCGDAWTWTYEPATGDWIVIEHPEEIRDANNDLDFSETITLPMVFYDIVDAVDITYLQNQINQTRENCICDSHCSCHFNCCDINCGTDDPFYP